MNYAKCKTCKDHQEAYLLLQGLDGSHNWKPRHSLALSLGRERSSQKCPLPFQCTQAPHLVCLHHEWFCRRHTGRQIYNTLSRSKQVPEGKDLQVMCSTCSLSLELLTRRSGAQQSSCRIPCASTSPSPTYPVHSRISSFAIWKTAIIPHLLQKNPILFIVFEVIWMWFFSHTHKYN